MPKQPFDTADPFGWEAEQSRYEAELQAENEEWNAEQEAEDERRWAEELKFHLSYNEGRILFALVTLAADPHLTQAPVITVEQWAQHFNIRPTQVTYAFRRLYQFGIPKPPAPIPLDGLLRFLAEKVKARAERFAGDYLSGGPEGLFEVVHAGWIGEYFKTHTGGPA